MTVPYATRRALVRAGALAVPALAMSAAPAAGAGPGLLFEPGGTRIVWDESGAMMLSIGADAILTTPYTLTPGQLKLSVTFEPSPGWSANRLVPRASPTGWLLSPLSPLDVAAATVHYSYNGTVYGQGGRLRLAPVDLRPLGPALPLTQQQGRLRLTFWAPAFPELAPTVHVLATPAPPIVFTPGQSVVVPADEVGRPNRAGVRFGGAQIRVHVAVAPGALRLRVEFTDYDWFTPIPGMYVVGGPPGWTQPVPGEYYGVTYTYLAAATPSLALSLDGMYFTTRFALGLQAGWYTVTASGPGLGSAALEFDTHH